MPSVLQHGQGWWVARSTRHGSFEDLALVAGIGVTRMPSLLHFGERERHSECKMEVPASSSQSFTSWMACRGLEDEC